MQMTPGVRRFALTLHVTSSVGWLGAVTALFALTVVGLKATGAPTMQAAYLSMNIVGEFVIVPFGVAALVTGIVQSLTTPWGLFRHYWVLTKFVLTVIAVALLLLHQFMAVAVVAQRVLDAGARLPEVGALGRQLVVDAAGAFALLVAATVISIFKPWGRIEQRRTPRADVTASMPPRLRLFLAILAALLATVIVIHLAGLGQHHH